METTTMIAGRDSSVLAEVKLRIGLAQLEQRRKSVQISPITQRIVERFMVGNESETIELLVRLAEDYIQRQSADGNRLMS